MRTATVRNEKLNAVAQVAAAPVADKKKPDKISEPIKKKRSPWIWVGIGAFLFCCFIFAVSAIRNNNRRNNPQSPAAPATSVPVIQSPLPVLPTVQLPPTPLPTPFNQPPGPGNPGGSGGGMPGGPPPTIANASPEVQAAIEAVTKDPRNPDAHLQLALALWDMKEFRPAFDETMQAANLADPNTPDFFVKAAEEFRKREAWPLASSMYLRLIPIYRGSQMPEDMQNNFRESVYRSAEQTAMLDLKSFERLDNFNQPFAHLVRGRQALYNNNIEEARIQLKQAKKLKPDMPEISLLEAEIAMKTGDRKTAKDILTLLSTNTAISEWIRIMADNYLKPLQ
jgi:tetratricopeptide (TPR) repeat protein